MAINGKKGYYFSLTVLILLILIYVYFTAQKEPGYTKQAQITEQRLQEVNRIINLIEQDSATGLKIATFRSILTLNDNMSATNNYIDRGNFDKLMQELILNASISQEKKPLMENHSIINWQNNTERLLTDMSLNAEFQESHAKLTQTSPWYITAHYNTTILIEDGFTKSTWNKTINTKIDISITDFYDPLYSINTQGQRKITRKPNDVDLDNLSEIINQEYYTASNKSPSFLQRFQNPDNFTPSNYTGVGIESLTDLTNTLTPPTGKPIIDSIYFNYNSHNSNADCNTTEGYLLAQHYNNTYGVLCD
ncbi:MAG: hypothetical protein ACLFN8_00340 [Candidatus Woesearchaeota archaeon]